MKRKEKLGPLGVDLLMMTLLPACGSGGTALSDGDNPGDNPDDNLPFSWTVGLVVKNDLARDRSDEPVSYGVPLSESGDITPMDRLSITPQGETTPINYQSNVVTRYNGLASGPTKPIRMRLCTFFADVPANSQVQFELIRNSIFPFPLLLDGARYGIRSFLPI